MVKKDGQKDDKKDSGMIYIFLIISRSHYDLSIVTPHSP
jgi:hypothetical protein